MSLDEKMELQDANIKKMAKALREGARMLDLACPICNNPIFQYKSGEKVCVACGRKVLFEEEVLQVESDGKKSSSPSTVKIDGKVSKSTQMHAHPSQGSIHATLSVIKQRCGDNLALLANIMDQTTDQHELSVVYGNILRLLEILKQIGPL